MDASYISALAALTGAAIGGLTSFATTWTTQRMQFEHARRHDEVSALGALYSDFITEAARLFGDAQTKQADEIIAMMRLYAMIGRMRLISDPAVVLAAARVEEKIVENYLGPNRTLRELMQFVHEGEMQFLADFGEACRKDLASRTKALR